MIEMKMYTYKRKTINPLWISRPIFTANGDRKFTTDWEATIFVVVLLFAFSLFFEREINEMQQRAGDNDGNAADDDDASVMKRRNLAQYNANQQEIRRSPAFWIPFSIHVLTVLTIYCLASAVQQHYISFLDQNRLSIVSNRDINRRFFSRKKTHVYSCFTKWNIRATPHLWK